MRKIAFLFFILNAFTFVCAQQPKQLASELLSKMEKTSFKANYMVSVSEKATDAPLIYRGNILLKGTKFHVFMEDTEVYFDGKTQWIYMESAEEISITEPTAEDIAEINPILMVKALIENCELRFSASEKKADSYIIDFFPKKAEADVQKLTLRMRKSDKMLIGVTLKAVKGMTTTLILSNQQLGVETKDNDFVLDTTKYKDVMINDLR